VPSPSLFKRAARRFAKPLLGPVDGRIGDVNRRVGSIRDSIDELGRKVGAQTTTVTESNSYLGVELRRFGEELQGLNSDIAEHERRVLDQVSRSHAERLDLSTHLPLEQLDGATANLINHATGHRGFLAEAGLWFNPPLTVELGEGSARLGSVNERIVELPFAFGVLARLAPPARVLDIGGAESTFALSAASLGYSVTALDLREIPYRHPNLQGVVGRFEDWDPGDEQYDAIFLISTIEHIGLGAYGERAEAEDADRRALDRARDLLADDGVLVLTTPFGTRAVDDLERTYDAPALAELLAGWTVLDRRIVHRLDGQTWSPAGAGEDERSGVAMVVAAPPTLTREGDRQAPSEHHRRT
jgi:Methyltransferase domain